jgi:lysophospholipase L1-like esterase
VALRRRRFGILALVLGAALTVLLVVVKQIETDNGNTKDLLVLGDSFVAGEGATEMNGWAQRLAASFDEAVVSGEGGDTTESLSGRVDRALNSDYEIILVEIGLNDSRFRRSLGRNEVAPPEFRDRLARLIEKLSTHTDRLGVLGLTRVDETKTTPYKRDKYYFNQDIEVYDTMLREIAASKRVTYVRVPTLLEAPDLLFDGLHPSDTGHARLLSAVSEQIAAWNPSR